MNDSDFDPYHKWLSIPPVEQPANHYRLLGVPLFESDQDVIDSAAQRQITHVRSFALGQHAEQSQSILNELAKARATLLDPAAKAKYDASLNAQRQQPAVAPSPPNAVDDLMQAVPFDIPNAPVAPRKISRPNKRRQQSSKLIPLVAGFAVALIVIATIGWLLSNSKQPLVAELPVSEQPNQEVQAVEVESEVQPAQSPSRLGSILDSARPSSGGNTETMDQESAGSTEAEAEPETTPPTERKEVPAKTVVVSSEILDANKTPPPAVAPFDAAKARQHQEAWAKHLGVEVETENSIGMKLRVIPPGTFMRGSEDGPDGEKPFHEVTLTKPILLGLYEVTQEQYERVMRVNPSNNKGDRNPVEMVTWNDATEFCRRLSLLPREKRAGRIYRLPTEAEWEFACRAGTTTTYSFGDDESLLSEYAWYRENGGRNTYPVGSKLANPFGLYDMHGNVWEWCKDWSGSYPSGSVTDPVGPKSGSARVPRGGSGYHGAERCRSAGRGGNPPSRRYLDFGFRVTCVPSGQPSAEVAASAEMDSGEQDVPDALASPPIEPINNSPAPALAPFDEAKAREYQEAWAKYLGVEVETENSIGMKLRVIPPGTFMMGSDSGNANNQPVHQVTLTKPFLLGVHEVTQDQYEQVMGNNPSHFQGRLSRRNPVESVNWEDAVEFCQKLSEIPTEEAAGRTYRLLTEAEWEYACRSGTVTTWSSGDNVSQLSRYAWYGINSVEKTHPVGVKFSNAWGIHDMHGNVWEWCSDLHGKYSATSEVDPRGKSMGSRRIYRGGSYVDLPEICSSARRPANDPSITLRNVGFRVACVPSGQ